MPPPPGYEEEHEPAEFVPAMQQAEPILEGRPYRIECEVTARPAPAVFWYKDGRPVLTDGGHRTTFVDGVATLDIDCAQREDAGVYECMATNAVGTSRTTVNVPCKKLAQCRRFRAGHAVSNLCLFSRLHGLSSFKGRMDVHTDRRTDARTYG